jgi:hypothetical protein
MTTGRKKRPQAARHDHAFEQGVTALTRGRFDPRHAGLLTS